MIYQDAHSFKYSLKPLSVFFGLVLSVVSLYPDCSFGATGKDIQLLSRALKFSVAPLGKEVVVIYDNNNSPSISESDEIVSLLIKSGYNARKTSVSDINSVTSSKILFVTKSLQKNWGVISSYSSTRKILTVTMDDECVKAGGCILGIQSAPQISVKLNKAASEAANIKFGTAFKMMIKEY